MDLQSKTEKDSRTTRITERRRTPRFEATNLVHMTSLDKQGNALDFATGLTINLSTGGMRLEMLSHPLPKGSRVRLSLRLSGEEVNLEAQLIYVEELDRDRYAVGVEFDPLSDELELLVADYLASRSEDQE